MITCCHAGDSPYIYDDEDIVAPKHLQAGSVRYFFHAEATMRRFASYARQGEATEWRMIEKL